MKSGTHGVLLALVAGLAAPIGTASAQDRGRDADRGQGFGWEEARHENGRGPWQREEAARVEARETERQEFLQKAAVAAKARQEVRRQRVESQRARVEQRRQVALASQQRAQERARARQQAQQEWEQQRAARRDTARQERREAQLVRERQHRAWAAINLRVSTERRQGVWHYANQQYQGERRFAVRAELRRHARKTEYLDRLRSAASEVNEPQLLERVAIMFNEEGVRHQHRMDRLGASLTRQ